MIEDWGIPVIPSGNCQTCGYPRVNGKCINYFCETNPIPTDEEQWVHNRNFVQSFPILDSNEPLGPCTEECGAGECLAPGTHLGCGGCCGCMNACYKDAMEEQHAPMIWQGDDS